MVGQQRRLEAEIALLGREFSVLGGLGAFAGDPVDDGLVVAVDVHPLLHEASGHAQRIIQIGDGDLVVASLAQQIQVRGAGGIFHAGAVAVALRFGKPIGIAAERDDLHPLLAALLGALFLLALGHGDVVFAVREPEVVLGHAAQGVDPCPAPLHFGVAHLDGLLVGGHFVGHE